MKECQTRDKAKHNKEETKEEPDLSRRAAPSLGMGRQRWLPLSTEAGGGKPSALHNWS